MNRPRATLSLLDHRGAKRIKVEIANTAESKTLIRSVPDRKWSRTNHCWHVPYPVGAFGLLKQLFEVEIAVDPNKHNNVLPTEHDEPDKPQFIEYLQKGTLKRKVVGDKVIVEMHGKGWLRAYVPYDRTGWVSVVREIAGRKWDPVETCWMLPYVKASFYSLKKYIGLEHVVFNFDIQSDIPDHFTTAASSSGKHCKKPPNRFEQLPPSHRAAIKSTENALILRHYSYSTLKVYRSHLAGLFLFHISKRPENLQPKDVRQYLLYQIKTKRVSESTQNQVINAYKAYVEKVLGRQKEWVDIPRPKKPKRLPNVLSEEEVVKLISTPDNIKHKLILPLVCSAGLRPGELVNIRLKDINLDRRTIFTGRAKGKKDRYVTLAETAIPYIRKYRKEQNPLYWLFEGQSGGQYSKRSVRAVFRKVLEGPEVNAHATVHTLREFYGISK